MRVRTVRRLVMTCVVVGAAAFAMMNPGVVKAFYEDLYPSDPAKRQALELCFMQDHLFNRVDPGAREACYRRMLPTLAGTSAAPAEDIAATNLVDLQRAAGAGNMPRNDIRRLEQNETAPRAPGH